MKIKTVICAAGGTAASAFSYLVGGFTPDMTALIIFMAIDYLTGIICAAVFKNSAKTESGALSSYAGFKGIAKKIIMIFLVATAHSIDMFMKTEFIKTAVIYGFILNEIISITENAGLMGITSPVIKDALDMLKRGKKDDNEKNT